MIQKIIDEWTESEYIDLINIKEDNQICICEITSKCEGFISAHTLYLLIIKDIIREIGDEYNVQYKIETISQNKYKIKILII